MKMYFGKIGWCLLLVWISEWDLSNTSDSNEKKLIIYDMWDVGNDIDPVKYLSMALGIRSPDDPEELPELWDPCRCTAVACICSFGIRYADHFDNEIAFLAAIADASIVLGIIVNENVVAAYLNPLSDPICVPILLPIPTMACIYFYNFGGEANSEYAQLCFKLELKVLMLTNYEIPFDCIRFYPAEGVKYVPADTPYLAEVEERISI